MTEPYTDELFDTLYRINRDVNGDVQYVSDMSNFGLQEYWAVAGMKGDCEDMALKKRKLLRLHLRNEDMNIAICKIGGQGHAVLVVDTSRGDYVLDINSDVPVLWFDYRVEWVMISVKGNFREWKQITSSQP